MYKDYEIKLNAILDKHKGVQKVELGLIDDLEKETKKAIDKFNSINSSARKAGSIIDKAESEAKKTK